MAINLLVTFSLFSAASALIYVYLVWHFGYWRKRGVVEIKSYPLAGSFPSTLSKKRHVVLDINDIYNKYKCDEKFVGIFVPRKPQLLLLDPETIHKIYVNDFKHFHDNDISVFGGLNDAIFAHNPFVLTGEKWKESRLDIIPGMTPNRIKTVYPVTLNVCKRLNDFISKQIKMSSKDGIDTAGLCTRFTTEVISDCVLGFKAESFTENRALIFRMSQQLFEQSFIASLFQTATRILPVLQHIYTQNLVPIPVQEFFIKLMQQSIELRHKQNIERNDFLNYILQLQKKKQLTTPMLTSHVITFLTDGMLTTSVVVSHTLLGLARESSKQEKLREEIRQNVDEDGNLSFETLSELPYLNACIHEGLRLFPPLAFNGKICTQPYEFTNNDGNTLKLRTGDVIVVPIYALHHDERFYANAERFNPDRFLVENHSVKDYRERGMYLGFGDGPRVCLGQRFALTQGKAAIVEIIKNFKIKVNPKTRSDDALDKNQFIAMLDGGIWLDYEPLI